MIGMTIIMMTIIHTAGMAGIRRKNQAIQMDRAATMVNGKITEADMVKITGTGKIIRATNMIRILRMNQGTIHTSRS